MKILQRYLNEKEILSLDTEIKNFPDLKYVGKERWKNFQNIYVLEADEKLAGVCVVNKLKKWCKLGPLVVLSGSQKRGCAKKLLIKILNDLKQYNLYITSSNPAVGHLALLLGFQEVRVSKLPLEIYKYLISNFSWIIDRSYISEFFRKNKIFGFRKHKHYIKFKK